MKEVWLISYVQCRDLMYDWYKWYAHTCTALGGVLIYLVWLNNIKVGGCNKEKIVALNMENPYTKLKLDWILDR